MTPPGFDLVVVDPGTPQFIEAAQRRRVLLGLARQMGGEFFRSAPKLKLVQLLSAGYDRVDIEAARKAKVPVSNNGGANAIAVAEHTLTLILAVLKRVVKFHNDIVAGKWRVGDPTDTPRVRARRAHGWASSAWATSARRSRGERSPSTAKVLYYDIAPAARAPRRTRSACGSPSSRAAADGRRGQPARAARRFHAQDDRHQRAGADEAHAIIVNTCRGPVIDENALYTALKDGRIAGAGLDVMVEEPPKPNHPLFSLPNVTFTPHSAGPTAENWTARFRNGFDNIQRVAAGRAPLWVVPELTDLLK